MAHPISPVKLVEVCRVAPEPFLPDSANTKTFDQSLPLTLFDLLWLRFAPTERLYFYSTSSTDSVIPKLKASLSVALQHFPPLAGNLIWPEHSVKPVLTYVQGDAVLVTVAESDADFDNLSNNYELIAAKEYNPLVPQLEVSHDRAAVMAVQITVFPGRGFSIATSMHHAILDGKTSTSFVKVWAHICKNNSEEPPPASLLPFFDRMAVKDPAHLSELYSKQLQNMDGRSNNRSLCIPPPHKPPQPDMIRGCFEFTRARIQTLREHVKEMASYSDSTQLHLSTFSLACAYTWVCLAKAAEIKKDKSVFIFGVDCRTRLEPPIPANYFGNCIVGRIAVAETKGLMGEDGLVVAVKAITEAIKSLDEGVLNGAENWVSKLLDFSLYDRIFSIGGSPRFEVYGTDFGWGRAKRVEMMSIDKNGAASLSDSKNGGGGVEVGLVLKKEHMEAFASLFADQLSQPSTTS